MIILITWTIIMSSYCDVTFDIYQICFINSDFYAKLIFIYKARVNPFPVLFLHFLISFSVLTLVRNIVLDKYKQLSWFNLLLKQQLEDAHGKAAQRSNYYGVET